MPTASKKSETPVEAKKATPSAKAVKAPAKSAKTADKTAKNEAENSLIAENTKITITLPWTTVHESYKKQLARFAKNLKTDGFRKGKVPTHIAETMVDRERLIQAVLEEIVPAAYGKEIDKGDFKPLTHPDFEPKDLSWGKDWVMEAQFAQDPKISVKDYKKIVATAKKQAEKTWKEELAKIEKANNAAKKDDKHNHDHDHEGHDHTDHDHAGHDHSHAHGETKTPEQIEAARKEHTLHAIFRELITTLKPAIPEMLIRENTRQEIKDLEEQLKRVNATLDQFLQQRNQQFSDLAQEMAAQTLGKLQLEFILRAIQADLKITVTEKEIVAEYEKLMQGLPQVSQPDGKKTEVKLPPINDASREYIQRTLERRMLLDSILDLK